tara:strand:+ start:364 stop:1686 length:1323 start_codon:yes stop_codon:yes gene_type:complete
MSRILRRPLFRGGPVSSYGTGIASGLANGGMPAKRGLVDGPGGYSGQGYYTGAYPNPDDLYKKGVTGANVVQGAKDKWMSGNKKIYGPSSEWGEKPTIEELVGGDGRGVGRNIYNEDPILSYLYTKGDDPESESGDFDIISKEWVNEKVIKENKLKEEYEESGSELPYEDWKVIDAQEKAIAKEQEAVEKEKESALTLGGTGGAGILKVDSNPQVVNSNTAKVIEPAESYEINADDVRAQAALFDELLNEGYEKDKRSAQISDASDYALQFFKSTVGEGKGIKEAAGDVAGRALTTPSRTEKVQEGKKKTKQTATVMAINEAIAQGKSARDIDMLIAKSGLDLKNKKDLVDYGQTLTKGFKALATHTADSKKIGFVAQLKDGLRKSGLIGYPTVTTTSTDMADETKFKFDKNKDTGRIFIETDTETAYVFDENGKKTPVA